MTVLKIGLTSCAQNASGVVWLFGPLADVGTWQARSSCELTWSGCLNLPSARDFAAFMGRVDLARPLVYTVKSKPVCLSSAKGRQ